MSKTLRKTFSDVALAACLALSTSSIHADTFTQKDGLAYEGTISSIVSHTVSLKLDSGDTVELDTSTLTEATLLKTESWKNDNPTLVNVYTKWDVKPVVKRSYKPELPRELNKPDFKGIVSVQVILDEKGRVIHGVVKKSTHPELETPALQAAKHWIFSPAKVASKSVKAKFNLSFRYAYEEGRS